MEGCANVDFLLFGQAFKEFEIFLETALWVGHGFLNTLGDGCGCVGPSVRHDAVNAPIRMINAIPE